MLERLKTLLFKYSVGRIAIEACLSLCLGWVKPTNIYIYIYIEHL
jgi:hypothetical protein